MYIHSLVIKNLRCFRDEKLTFQYPGRKPGRGEPPIATRSNVNLLLGNNGSGKTTLLKGIALALTAPVLQSSGFHPYSLVRRVFVERRGGVPRVAEVSADVIVTPQDSKRRSASREELFCRIERHGDEESVARTTPRRGIWRQMSDKQSPAFLVVGYGATRRMAPAREAVFTRTQKANLRYQRVQGLFDEEMTLMPLSEWLPKYRNAGRRRQVINLLDQLLDNLYKFEGRYENEEYVFKRGDSVVPLGALSDGYRAFIAWVSDLLYHVCFWCGTGRKLRDIEGIVMVDEIDLHLHPEWQRTIIKTLSETFPKIQFFFTSHSPLITGSLEWSNIWVMHDGRPVQLPDEPINGLSADQVLLSPYFGIGAVRSERKMTRLRQLDALAQTGDRGAAQQYLRELSVANEVTEKEYPMNNPPALKVSTFRPPDDLAKPPPRQLIHSRVRSKPAVASRKKK